METYHQVRNLIIRLLHRSKIGKRPSESDGKQSSYQEHTSFDKDSVKSKSADIGRTARGSLSNALDLSFPAVSIVVITRLFDPGYLVKTRIYIPRRVSFRTSKKPSNSLDLHCFLRIPIFICIISADSGGRLFVKERNQSELIRRTVL